MIAALVAQLRMHFIKRPQVMITERSPTLIGTTGSRTFAEINYHALEPRCVTPIQTAADSNLILSDRGKYSIVIFRNANHKFL